MLELEYPSKVVNKDYLSDLQYELYNSYIKIAAEKLIVRSIIHPYFLIILGIIKIRLKLSFALMPVFLVIKYRKRNEQLQKNIQLLKQQILQKDQQILKFIQYKNIQEQQEMMQKNKKLFETCKNYLYQKQQILSNRLNEGEKVRNEHLKSTPQDIPDRRLPKMSINSHDQALITVISSATLT